jgi:hypothetical protein
MPAKSSWLPSSSRQTNGNRTLSKPVQATNNFNLQTVQVGRVRAELQTWTRIAFPSWGRVLCVHVASKK